MQICPDCHSNVDDDAFFCDQCGFQLKARPSAARQVEEPVQPVQQESIINPACPACGYQNPPGETYCANCGVQLSQEQVETKLEPIARPASIPGPENVPSEGEIKICPTCGADNLFGADFCDNCGFWLAALVPGLAQPPPVLPEADQASQPAPLQPIVPTASAAVAQAPLPAAPSAFETMTVARSAGRLFSTITNTSLPLPPQAEIILGRRDPDRGIYPDVDLSGQGTAGNSVSRQHARLLIQGSQVYVEDLNSTNATYLNRQRLQPGQRYLLNNGDELRLGGVALVYYAA